jgi:hypothetical protein
MAGRGNLGSAVEQQKQLNQLLRRMNPKEAKGKAEAQRARERKKRAERGDLWARPQAWRNKAGRCHNHAV